MGKQIIRSACNAVGGQGLGSVHIVLVHREVHDLVSRACVLAARDIPRLGHGWRDVAALAAIPQQEKSGGRVVLGGEYDTAAGAYAPTVVENVPPSSIALMNAPATPAVYLVQYNSTEEAINIAQDVGVRNLYVFGAPKEVDYFASTLRPASVAAGIPLDYLGGSEECPS
jgi:acyl-CoA reductase-like NAD-dependent aldehyde dehydrogenase